MFVNVEIIKEADFDRKILGDKGVKRTESKKVLHKLSLDIRQKQQAEGDVKCVCIFMYQDSCFSVIKKK